VYQPQRCIEWWTDQRDHAIWRIDGASAGEYDVQLEWSIPDEMADNKFEVVNLAKDSEFEASIPTTGGFKHFKTAQFGRVTLDQGENALRVQPTAPIKGELADLRAVRLTPIRKNN